MQRYRSRKPDTGVRAFALHKTAIDIEFRDGKRYRYDYTRPGKEKVEIIKHLALAGAGLTTFINQHVREVYVCRLRSAQTSTQ
jgi:hypothetical protein